MTTTYGYQPDGLWTTAPIFIKQGSQYGYYLNDRLGVPRKIVGVNGAELWSAAYASFGETDVVKNVVENNLRLPGQYSDKETGFYYNYKRYYDPQIGRYLSLDPLGLEAGINAYLYVGGNPLAGIDPTGEFVQIGVGIGIGAAAGFFGALINGASVSEAIMSGLIGAAMGGITAAYPWASGALIGGLANAIGQAGTIWMDDCKSFSKNFNFGSFVGAMLGGRFAYSRTRNFGDSPGEQFAAGQIGFMADAAASGVGGHVWEQNQ